MKLYSVYMVACSDGKIYTGLTNNLERRIIEHNQGLNKESYTYSRRPVKLLFAQEFIQFEQAERFEKQIKKWGRAKKLALANADFDILPELAKCKNETHHANKPLL